MAVAMAKKNQGSHESTAEHVPLVGTSNVSSAIPQRAPRVRRGVVRNHAQLRLDLRKKAALRHARCCCPFHIFCAGGRRFQKLELG